MHKLLPAALGVAGLALAACGGGGGSAGPGAGGGTTTVVASFYPLAEVAERVGGGRVTVENLTPPGSEPHDLEVGPREVEAVNGADLAIVLGRGFQPALEQVAEGRNGETIEVLAALVPEGGEVGEHDHAGEEERGGAADGHGAGDGSDPHVWLDPVSMVAIVEEVAHHLAEVDPDGAAEYERNAAAYAEEITELHGRFEEALADCQRDLVVVQHEAFGWMTERYGLRQEGIAGLSPEQEPDPRRLAELVELVAEEGVTTVFTETLVSPRIAETLAREAGVATATLDPLEGLTDDQLAAGETYLSVMEGNLERLRAGLGCP